MIHLAPFQDLSEHRAFCAEGKVPFEEGSIGFKIFSDTEKLGLCQIKFVGTAAYVLSLVAISDRISSSTLAEVFSSVLQFLRRLEVESVVFPIQKEEDIPVAEALGFDRVSDTLFVFDFAAEEKEECHCGHCHDAEQ